MTELNRIRVLLADDNKAMLSRITKLLTANCDVVGEMSDGRQALKAVKELKPDILVLDISMPVMDGIETAQRLRQANSKTRIVFLSVHDDSEFVRTAMDTGAMGYVIKPRMVSDLSVAINEVYAGRTFVSPLRAGLAGKQGK